MPVLTPAPTKSTSEMIAKQTGTRYPVVVTRQQCQGREASGLSRRIDSKRQMTHRRGERTLDSFQSFVEDGLTLRIHHDSPAQV